ncbi:hypothetical protein ERHA55_47120 [Erwinia rhapontici]|nr:hypothetical protein ERHA55_47120 [Erwinia rhapontici]
MRISYQQLKQEFLRVLLARGVAADKAESCATLFADTSENGVYSHGVNRFPRFIQQLDAGHIVPHAEAEKSSRWALSNSGMPTAPSVTSPPKA